MTFLYICNRKTTVSLHEVFHEKSICSKKLIPIKKLKYAAHNWHLTALSAHDFKMHAAVKK